MASAYTDWDSLCVWVEIDNQGFHAFDYSLGPEHIKNIIWNAMSKAESGSYLEFRLYMAQGPLQARGKKPAGFV